MQGTLRVEVGGLSFVVRNRIFNSGLEPLIREMRMKKFWLFALVAAFSSSAQAAWWIGQLFSTERQQISNDHVEFKYGDIICGAKETKFYRSPEGDIHEFRNLFCRAAKDTTVEVTVNCDYPRTSSEMLHISKGPANLSLWLRCGPEK